jgi:protein involved in polysaccharide export with SLBB domain
VRRVGDAITAAGGITERCRERSGIGQRCRQPGCAIAERCGERSGVRRRG